MDIVSALPLIKIAMSVIFLLAALGLLLIARRSGWLLPRTPLQWAGALLSVVALCGSLAATLVVRRMEKATQQIGQNISALRLTQVTDDAALSLAQYQGKVVLLNYWATW